MKSRRQQAMLHVIQTRDVCSQEELQSLLKGRGFDITQATISRDIKDLGLVKSPVRDAAGRTFSKYTLQQNGVTQASRLHRFVNELVESIANTGIFVVIKTPPRCALMVGSELDKAAWPEILGTITGDDTIFCICGSPAQAKKAVRQLRAMKQP
jgi:transcriptional regulator of arginine metabolism